jgi:dethiobiotin synthetase
VRAVPDPAPGRPGRLVVVVGTGTEVGKTWVSAVLLGRLREEGHAVSARKPAQSFDPDADPGSTDAAVLGRATGEPAEVVCRPSRWYPVAMAPPMAAESLGCPGFSVADLAAEVEWPPVAPGSARPVIGLVETAGGVRSPQADDGDAVDLVRLLSPDVVLLVADAGLGAVNAVRLCVDALSRVCATAPAGAGPPSWTSSPVRLVVVLNRFDPADGVHRSNRAWLAGRDGLGVVVVPGEEGELCRRVLA